LGFDRFYSFLFIETTRQNVATLFSVFGFAIKATYMYGILYACVHERSNKFLVSVDC